MHWFARQAPERPPKKRGPRAFLARWARVAYLAWLQVRVLVNEPDEPVWPRPLTPRGTFMLASGFLSIGLGVSYVIPSAVEVTTVEAVRDVLPPVAYASLWVLSGVLIIVLGPTKWWHWGVVAVAAMHGAWATTSFLAWLMGDAPRGWVLAALYAHGAISCLSILRMSNPPRPQVLREVPGAR